MPPESRPPDPMMLRFSFFRKYNFRIMPFKVEIKTSEAIIITIPGDTLKGYNKDGKQNNRDQLLI